MAIETPVDVLRRLREQARQEQVAKAAVPAQAFRSARTGKQKASAFGGQIGAALAKAFSDTPDLEQDPAVLQAKQRQQWLNVSPDDVAGIKANIKAAADAGDYEVARYLTDMFYKSEQLRLKGIEAAADAAGTPRKDQSKIGKLIADRDAALSDNNPTKAAEIEKNIRSLQTGEESTAMAKQMEAVDTDFSTNFGINLEEDLDDADVGPQFQGMVDSVRLRTDKYGEGVSDARRDIQRYFNFEQDEFLGIGLKGGKFKLSPYADKRFKDGKIKFANDAGIWSMVDVSGKAPKLISQVEESLVPENIKKLHYGE